MKNILLLCLLALTLTSCIENKPIKVISTGEKAYVIDWEELYKVGDTIIIYKTLNSSWKLDSNWQTKKDTSTYSATYRVATIIKD